MLFELPTNTECELTTFVGRTQKSGTEDVPAVTFRLKLSGVSNILLDRFSKTIRHTIYKAVEGQEQLPGVEDTTPLLQSKNLVHWAPETCLEGWTVWLARGISDGSALQMGSCKVDNFRFDFFEGGRMDVDFRVSTADVDEDGAGMLWGRQKRKVFVTVTAPEMPAGDALVIDGTKGHPGAAAAAAAQQEAGDLFAQAHGNADQVEGAVPDDDNGDGTGASDQHAGDFGTANADEADLAAEAQRGGEDWPSGAAEQAELEAGMAQAMAAAGLKPKAARRPRRDAAGGIE